MKLSAFPLAMAVGLCMCISCATPNDASRQSDPLVVGTFNIRYDTKNDTGNLWATREKPVADLMRFHEFDIVGLQEGWLHQLTGVASRMPAFAWYGKNRDDNTSSGQVLAIFYKRERFVVKDSGYFWLSETPEKVSIGWDANQNRVCVWLRLQERKSGKEFYFFNTHFDHIGEVARARSAELVLEKIKQIAAGKPVVLTADFNSDQHSPWYAQLANSGIIFDSKSKVSDPYVPSSSLNEFGFSPAEKRAAGLLIDHIFVSSHFSVDRWGVLTDTYGAGKLPSDHFPVLARMHY